MAVCAARRRGFQVDEKTAAQQVKANVFGLEKLRDYPASGILRSRRGCTSAQFLVGYILIGLDAEHYKPDLNTDAVAMYLKSHQTADGEWPYPAADARPPICSDYIGQTAVSMRALQLYAPKADKASYDQAIQLAARGLRKRNPRTTTIEATGCSGWHGTARIKTPRRKPCGSCSPSRSPMAAGAISILWKAAPLPPEIAVRLADRRLAGIRRSLRPRRQIPAEHAAGGRIVVCQNARHGLPALLRRRLPPRLRPVDSPPPGPVGQPSRCHKPLQSPATMATGDR